MWDTAHAEPCRRPQTRGLPTGQGEIKSQIAATKQAVVQYRRDIAGLKRQLREQAKEIALLKAQSASACSACGRPEEPLENVRFSPRSVKAQRHRLRLSAADYGKLVGVSGLTIYHWEHGQRGRKRSGWRRWWRSADLAAATRCRSWPC